MIFTATRFSGAYVIEPERLEDERGFFARSYDEQEFAARGLRTRWMQSNISYSQTRGTLRGLHYQVAPHPEAKLVRCTLGALYDVIVDLRPASPTYKHWLSFELTAANRRLLYIPEGMGHGFQTLADETEIFYQMSETHHPECARGLRWDDPALGIKWPIENDPILSNRDRSFALLHPEK